MSLFPAFLKLQGRLVTVIGGGVIAESKLTGLLDSGARVRLISPRVNAKIDSLVRDARIEWWPKHYEEGDLHGAFLVIAATSLRHVNAAVFQEAEARGTLCNAVDDVDHCHFYYGSIVQRGDLQIAISTNGKSPALAQLLRQELEQQFGPEYAAWVDWLGAAREVLRAQSTDADTTKRWLHLLASPQMLESFLDETNQPAARNGAASCRQFLVRFSSLAPAPVALSSFRPWRSASSRRLGL